jgi:hypothetical protein
MSWKKVISSGSDASLGALTLASGLKIPLLATDAATSGGLISDEVLVIDGGTVKKIAQQEVTGLNTTYAINTTPPGLGLVANGTNNFTLSIVNDDLIHNSLGNITSSEHIKWSQTQASNSPDVIHVNNYLNNTYLTTTGLSQAATGNGIEQEISSSETQSWTHVGPLGSVGNGGSIGTNPGQPGPGYVPFSITTTGSITSQNGLMYTQGGASATSSTIDGNLNMGLEVYGPQSMSASNIQSSGNWQVNNYLGIEGTFWMDTLGFQETIIQNHSGSHNWGGPAANTVTTWLGDITVVPPAAVTSSGGLYGDGSQLTGLVPSGVTFAGLDFTATPYGVTGSTEFDFTADATYSIDLDSATDSTPSGFTASAAGLRVKDLGVTTTFLDDLAVHTGNVLDANVVSASLSQSLISDFTDYTGSTNFNADAYSYLLYDVAGVTKRIHPAYIAGGVNAAFTGSNGTEVGSVTSVGVTPAVGSSINGLYLTITDDVNTTPQIALAGSISNLNNSNWATNDLAVTRGGTGASTLKQAAINIFGVSQEGSLSLGNGSTGEHITISGSLQTNSTSSAVKSANFASEDQFITIAQGDTGATDSGIKFGSDATSSNTIVYDGSQGNAGRFSLAETTALNTNSVTGLKHHLIGVLSGSGDGTTEQVDLPGNMKVNAGEIYLYVA